jgi:tRNA (guanosine-2'-O-)-methyltransferase
MTGDMARDTGWLTSDQAERFLRANGPEPVTATLGRFLSESRVERIEQVLGRRLVRLTVVVENLHDPRNGAAAIRSAEAVGLQDFHAIEGLEPFVVQPGVTLSGERWMDVHRHPDTRTCYDALARRGFVRFAAAPEAEATLESLPVDRPLALVFGNEHAGLTAPALADADQTFRIPMHGFTESFNLSVSVALSVHSVAERVRRALGAEGDLPDDRKTWLRARWYCLSVRAAGLILREAGLNEDTP